MLPILILVRPGDSLSAIGARLGVDWHSIASANGVDGPAYVIHPGQDLVIPGAGVPAPAPAPPQGSVYTVRSGDSLSAIGARLGVSWRSIATANGISGPAYVIYPGQVLAIPGAGAAPAPAGRTYTVVSGDSLSAIGAKVGVDWHAIAAKNGIPGPKYIIHPGDVLHY
jgi:LysM repeat protein